MLTKDPTGQWSSNKRDSIVCFVGKGFRSVVEGFFSCVLLEAFTLSQVVATSHILQTM